MKNLSLLFITCLLLSKLAFADGPQLPPLTVEEQDGSPSVIPVIKIKVSNGTITNDGAGQIQLTTGGGEVNTGSNLGTGNPVFKQKSGVDLQFRTLTSGDNVSMVTNANDVQIAVSSIPSNDITGVLDIANGGTGRSSHTDGAILIGKGSGAFENTGVLAKGTIIVGDGATNPTTLVVGADGTILSADSSTASGLTFATRNSILPVNAKGSIITYSTVPLELPVGANGTVLSADSSTASGLKWVAPPGAAGGESNTASNVGTGNPWFKQKSGVDLEFRTIVSGDNVSAVTNANDVTISVASVPTEDITGIFDVDADTNLTASGLLALAANGNLTTTAELNTTSNVGTGNQIFKQKTGSDFELRTLTSGDNVAIATNASDLAISVASIPSNDITGVLASASGGTGHAASTKGDLLVSDGSTWIKLSVGANGTILTADSAQTTGVKWIAPPTTSAAILAQITDETGTGLLAFATSPTLTTPRFADLGYLADSNGNEMLGFDLAASAVNFISISNDATGKYPTVTVSGDDANIGLILSAKGNAPITSDHAFAQRVVTLTDAATIATNAAQGNIFTVQLGGNRTLGAPTNPTPGQKAVWIISQDGTGSRTLGYSPVFRFGTTVTSPTLSTAAGKNDYIGAIYNERGATAATKSWDVVSVALGY